MEVFPKVICLDMTYGFGNQAKILVLDPFSVSVIQHQEYLLQRDNDREDKLSQYVDWSRLPSFPFHLLIKVPWLSFSNVTLQTDSLLGRKGFIPYKTCRNSYLSTKKFRLIKKQVLSFIVGGYWISNSLEQQLSI